MASKGLSGAAPVLEGYGLSCEHDLSLLVQEDLNALSSQLTPFHSRILRTWVQGLAAADQHHKRDKKRAAGDVNDAPAAKEHSNAPPSGTTLSWQCSRSTTNAISELLLFCVYVCVMRYIFISVLFSLGVRGVCVRCGYEDRIHFGRILEALSGLDKD
jgi:hypothetical protein